MKPWREVAVPHRDVLDNTFQQSEFAADITAVRNRNAPREYQDPADFFQRTFITEGMRLLLTHVVQRLNGQGGEPVIQLQTQFGGGKTHTMLAVYHLARRECALKDLAGIPSLLDRAGLIDVPRAKVAVLDGNAHAPGQPWTHGDTVVRTLWGELAWQLGEEEAFALVREADQTGTSPGKETLRILLQRYAPCVVLVDELVAYVRQFPEGVQLSGGTFESNLSFVQALTEAMKQVKDAILLASLPESDPKKQSAANDVQVGGEHGYKTLLALEAILGRVQALWKPVTTEEAFEIVRRRLFEPIRDVEARNQVCREFASTYATEGTRLPSETHEARYFDRLVNAYPIHPEVFDRLYDDWTTLRGFQRTRGALRLMARVIHRLWKDQNADLMILPGSLPLYDAGTRNELVYYLPAGWDAVLDRDIDGDRAETTDLDVKEPRFGKDIAARRVARTLFLGSAPSSGGMQQGIRGLDRARMLLGCVQPGRSSSTFSDALNRLCDRLHYLNSSGDKAQSTTRFWFDTRTNLRREMEDRKGRFDDARDVRGRISDVLKKLTVGSGMFEGVHVFTPPSDVPDDSTLRLWFLPPDKAYSKQDSKAAIDEVLETVRPSGGKPRYRGNRLVFVAPDQGALLRLRDCARTVLAWESIVKDIKAGRLNVDKLQESQAQKELDSAEGVVPRAARECYKWLLCPVMTSPTDRQIGVEAFPIKINGDSYTAAIERVCSDNELVISTWSPIHLRNRLRDLYWKEQAPAVRAAAVWEDMQRYFYLPRLKHRVVLEQCIIAGAASRDFFGTAYGQRDGAFEGFKLGEGGVQFDDTLLLVEPATAAAYEAAQRQAEAARLAGESEGRARADSASPIGGNEPPPATGTGGSGTGREPAKPGVAARSFFGSVDVNAATAKMKLVSVADEIIAALAADPNATVKVTVEISAEFPAGASDQTRRTVTENAASLGFKSKLWEG